MDFITQPDTTGWNVETIDIAILIDLADTAVRNLGQIEPESQLAILKAIKKLPLEHLDIEAICQLALLQDDYGVEHDEINEDVIDTAQEIMMRDDILPLVDVTQVMALLTKKDTPYRTMQACITLLAAMPAERIPFDKIVAIAKEYGDDDDAEFCAAVIDLLTEHGHIDDIRSLYDPAGDPDDDGNLATACREAVEEYETQQSA